MKVSLAFELYTKALLNLYMLMTTLSNLSPDDSGVGSPAPLKRQMQETLSLLFVEGVVRPEADRDEAGAISEWSLVLPHRVLRIACHQTELLVPRVHLELIAHDRPAPSMGWLLRTTAQWLLCWSPTNEVVVFPVNALRELICREPARLESATVLSSAGLAWATLEDVDYLTWKLEAARVLNLHYELNEPYRQRQLIGTHNDRKRCTADVFLADAAMQPPAPVKTLSDAVLKDFMAQIANVNRMRNEPAHRARIKTLPWKLN